MTVLLTVGFALGLCALAVGGIVLGWRAHQVYLDNGGRDDLG